MFDLQEANKDYVLPRASPIGDFWEFNKQVFSVPKIRQPEEVFNFVYPVRYYGAIRDRAILVSHNGRNYHLQSWNFRKLETIEFWYEPGFIEGVSFSDPRKLEGCYWPEFLPLLVGTGRKSAGMIRFIQSLNTATDLPGQYNQFINWVSHFRGYKKESRFLSVFFGEGKRMIERAYNLAEHR